MKHVIASLIFNVFYIPLIKVKSLLNSFLLNGPILTACPDCNIIAISANMKFGMYFPLWVLVNSASETPLLAITSKGFFYTALAFKFFW